MENTIYIGLSRQTALRREMSLVANNIANINTTAFKRELGVYATSQTDNGFASKLDFVIDHGTAVSFEPGSLTQTDNDLDISINGPGFFGVDDGSGLKYTRNGALSLSPDNQLITREGHAVVDEDGQPIVIPLEGGKIEIGRDGSISAGAEVISNNIANMNTTAFKRHRAEFQDLLYQDLRRVGSNSSDAGTIVPSGIQLGVGVRVASTYRVSEQGSLILTDNPLDLAIRGEGFFQIQLPTGETAYTRAGSFQVNAAGAIVNADGFTVLPGITVDQAAVGVTINQSGQVLVKLDGQVTEQVAGQLQLATFQNQAGLEHLGSNLLAPTEASGAAVTGNPGTAGFGGLFQGFIESSNVDPVHEITDLITAQRGYELNSKVIETADQMMATVNNIR